MKHDSFAFRSDWDALGLLTLCLIWPGRLAEEPAVNPDGLARYEIGVVAGEKNDRVGDVERRTDAAQRRQLRPHTGIVARLFLGALDLNRTGCDAIHRDAELS